VTLTQLQQRYKRRPKIHNTRRLAFCGSPHRRGTCLKVFTMPPRKPNSAVRKVARTLLSSRYRVTVYIEGISHNLKQHSAVLVRGGRAKDVPGVQYTTIRGKFDLHSLAARRQGRSKYGVRLADVEASPRLYHKVKIW
jgi:small subunit ribosomal protein S12